MVKTFNLASTDRITDSSTGEEIDIYGQPYGVLIENGSSNKIYMFEDTGILNLNGNNNTAYELSALSAVFINGNNNTIYASNYGNSTEIEGGSGNITKVNNANYSYSDDTTNSNTVEIGQLVNSISIGASPNENVIIDNFSQADINAAFNNRQLTAGKSFQYTQVKLGDTTVNFYDKNIGLYNIHSKNDDSNVFVQDMTHPSQNWVKADAFTGPNVGPIYDQYIAASTITDNLNLTYKGMGGFIKGSSGNDAIDVSHSTGAMNIMDGGTGSNFIRGSTTAENVFYLDDRGVSAATWSTAANAHSGDELIIWGPTANDFKTWIDNEGAVGFTGLTFQTTKNGITYQDATLSGYTSADLANGKLTVSYGHTADTNGLQGSDYMLIKVA